MGEFLEGGRREENGKKKGREGETLGTRREEKNLTQSSEKRWIFAQIRMDDFLCHLYEVFLERKQIILALIVC